LIGHFYSWAPRKSTIDDINLLSIFDNWSKTLQKGSNLFMPLWFLVFHFNEINGQKWTSFLVYNRF